MSFLTNILMEKEKEVALLKKNYQLRKMDHFHSISMYNTFIKSSTMNIIAEIKRASPSKGAINTKINPQEQAMAYEKYGAGVISVLTDSTFFKGSMSDLAAVRQVVELPILCKDFIIDESQIDRAKDYGANVVLLIAAALPKQRFFELYEYACLLNLEVLAEVHNEKEMINVLELGAKMIGINNRDLKTFTVDLQVTEKLAKLVDREEILLISESGIRGRMDVQRMKDAGVRGILVGETFMRSQDLKESFNSLKIPIE
ncbi:indole-3-glycerol phosphate synthase TrpC [Bacillus sp. FJAT-49736]|uniref:indole-3-glycerol phosphate synthase TrpC n=1 Tax=Bacillus sp. FJAT-49736 TaxID=2833582 RepID=UPI001BC98571|nr:indole-3-glycerol phosphate synthase TrpC [Bacillus sp. FJAT-49736]MBS4175152.1 indole-3-glycerol phosphate synthase TrpC [Bacillus sp. FJAT-49736]